MYGRVWIVKKGIVYAVCLLAVVYPLTAGVAAAQVLPWSEPTLGSGFYSVLSGVPSPSVGDFRIIPNLLVAYKRLGLNFNVDVPAKELIEPFAGGGEQFPFYGSLLDTFPIDFKLCNADLLTGEVRLDAVITPNVRVYGSLAANIPRRVRVEAGVGPGFGVLIPQAYAWTGSRLQWSQFEIGASYAPNQAITLMAGIRWERTTVRFADPEPVPTGTILGVSLFPPGPVNIAVPFNGYGGDLRALICTPFIGVKFEGPYARCSLKIGSAAGSLKLPLRNSYAGPYRGLVITILNIPLIGAVRSDISEQASYTFKNAGLFLEGKVESDVRMTDSVKLTFWAEGSRLRIRGNGSLDLEGESTRSGLILGFPINVIPTGYRASQSGTSTLTQYSLSLGMSGSLTF